MGTVVRQEMLGELTTTLSFENYQDFLDYQKKEREQQEADLYEAAQRREEVINQMFAPPQEQAYWHLQLTKEEYYYLSCILGHLVPAGEISKSLLNKVGLDDLDCEDFDLIQFKGDEIGGYSITINEGKE